MNHSNKSSKARHVLFSSSSSPNTPRVSSQNPNLKPPRDETLTLDFKMLQEDHETLVTPRERETKYK
jgi:hypothetical protein